MMEFYKTAVQLDILKSISNPRAQDLEKLLGIVGGDDEELTRYFYDKLSPGWLELLDGAGEFECLCKKDAGVVERYKAAYLVECAERKAEVVLEVVRKVGAKDAWVQGKLAEAIGRMPEEIAVGGVAVVLGYLRGSEYSVWYFIGERAARLMVKLVEKHPKETFEIANAVLEIWWPGEDARTSLDNIRARFGTDEYKRLMFDFYRKVWEKRPFEATHILVGAYDRYVEEYNEEKGYDASEHLGISIEDLETIERLDYDLEAIVVKGICEAGRVVSEKESKRVSELLEDLEKRNKAIFHRVEMYLVRFVKEGAETERISKFIANRKFMENPWYQYEHRRLLNDKFGEVSDKAKKVFIEWVKRQKVSDERREEIKRWCEEKKEKLPDFEKMECQKKAEELYLVRSRDGLRELYEEYKKKAGVEKDGDLAPRRMVGEARFVGPTESSPVSVDEMLKMEPRDALEYVGGPSKWKVDTKKESFFHSPEEGLASTFGRVVQERVDDYAEVGVNEIMKLKPVFLREYFQGGWNGLREKKVREESFVNIIEIANYVIGAQGGNRDYDGVFRSIVYLVEGIFEEEELRKKIIKKYGDKIWRIVEVLTRHEGKSEAGDGDEDPHQRSINCVAGEAFTLVIRFGLTLKNESEKPYQKKWSEKVKGVLGYIIEKVEDARVRCVFGVWFAQLRWLEEKWVEDNLDKIFNETDDNIWDVIWGSYMSWGRPYRPTFEFLVDRGKYAHAVEKVESGVYGKHDKAPDEGLMEHLMIGFFNGWIGLEDEVLEGFFEKANAELRGKAARFLATGFKSLRGQPEENIWRRLKQHWVNRNARKRLREYWNTRLEVIKGKPEGNEAEAIELTGWVEDSVLPAKETLELLEGSLDLSGGKIGKMRDAGNFVKGVTKLGSGNELLALRCLKKAAGDENMHMPWPGIQDPLVEFLEGTLHLPEDVRHEAKEVADLYGRYNPDKFREIWERLRKARG